LQAVPKGKRQELKRLLASRQDRQTLEEIKLRLLNSDAALKTKGAVSAYITLAKEKLAVLADSIYKESLISLADFIMQRGFKDASSREK
ncbi:MAG: hypothetical protein NG712_03855, partial [Omnitrophica bacterium]|nr:hypothetical protein [Candidatus Omnitrophota bacterium]